MHDPVAGDQRTGDCDRGERLHEEPGADSRDGPEPVAVEAEVDVAADDDGGGRHVLQRAAGPCGPRAPGRARGMATKARRRPRSVDQEGTHQR